MADKEAARKSGRPLVVSRTPDVCKTPIGGATPPVPYPVTTDLSDALKVSSNVRFGGKPAFTFGSQTPDVRGDQAGTAGGVKSGTVGGECKPIRGSNTVRVNGQSVIRHGDPFIMNAGNTTGKLVYLEGGGGVASIDEPTIPPDQDESYFKNIADALDAAESAIEKEDPSALQQVGGFFKGAGQAAWEVVEFAGSAALYVVDSSLVGDLGDGIGSIYSDLTGEAQPAWLPSSIRGEETTDKIAETAKAIWDNPGLIWEGVKAPYVEAWAQGRYGEAIGRGTFEAVGLVLGAKGVDKLGKLGSIAGKLNKVDDIADVLTVAKRADAVVPDEFAGIIDELIDIKRVDGKLGDVIDAARQSGTLDDVLDLGKLSANDIDELVKLGKLSPEEAARAKKAATIDANPGDGVKIKGNEIPQGLSAEQFTDLSATVRQEAGHIGDDIVVHGSRASGTARATSDIDIAIRIPGDKFDAFVKSRFGIPNLGSAKERTMLHAISTGKVQAGEAGLRGLRRSIAKELGMSVDISVIRAGGPFDQGPFIPLR